MRAVSLGSSRLRLEVAVYGGPGDPELGGDLGHGVRRAPVGAEFLVHCPGDLGLAGGELGLLPPGTAPRPGRGQAVTGALRHQGVLELGYGAEDVEEHPPERGRSVDALVEHHKVDSFGLQLVGKGDQVLEGAPEPVQLGDDQLIVLPGHEQGLVQLRAPGQLAARLVDEDLVAANSCQGVPLGGGVLVSCRDPTVANAHNIL